MLCVAFRLSLEASVDGRMLEEVEGDSPRPPDCACRCLVLQEAHKRVWTVSTPGALGYGCTGIGPGYCGCFERAADLREERQAESHLGHSTTPSGVFCSNRLTLLWWRPPDPRCADCGLAPRWPMVAGRRMQDPGWWAFSLLCGWFVWFLVPVLSGWLGATNTCLWSGAAATT